MFKKNKFRGSLATFGFALALGLSVPEAFADISEYQVEAAYLFNFTKFVEWPSQAFEDERSPLVIGILGINPFGNILEGVVAGKSVGNRKIVVRRFESFDADRSADLRKCQILFIAYSEKDRMHEIMDALRGASVLTVSEIDNFTSKGGMVLFDQEGQKIALAVNLKAAQKARLEISSSLLQICKIYKSE